LTAKDHATPQERRETPKAPPKQTTGPQGRGQTERQVDEYFSRNRNVGRASDGGPTPGRHRQGNGGKPRQGRRTLHRLVSEKCWTQRIGTWCQRTVRENPSSNSKTCTNQGRFHQWDQTSNSRKGPQTCAFGLRERGGTDSHIESMTGGGGRGETGGPSRKNGAKNIQQAICLPAKGGTKMEDNLQRKKVV